MVRHRPVSRRRSLLVPWAWFCSSAWDTGSACGASGRSAPGECGWAFFCKGALAFAVVVGLEAGLDHRLDPGHVTPVGGPACLADHRLARGVPGMDQAAQRPLRLHGPDRARVALGAVLIVPQQVRQARLVPRLDALVHGPGAVAFGSRLATSHPAKLTPDISAVRSVLQRIPTSRIFPPTELKYG
jgi:hypothetical protein